MAPVKPDLIDLSPMDSEDATAIPLKGVYPKQKRPILGYLSLFMLLLSFLYIILIHVSSRNDLNKASHLNALLRPSLEKNLDAKNRKALEQALQEALSSLWEEGISEKAMDATLPPAQIQQTGQNAPIGEEGVGDSTGLEALQAPAQKAQKPQESHAQGVAAEGASKLTSHPVTAPAAKIEAPDLAYITNTFQGFIQKVRARAPQANQNSSSNGSYRASDAVIKAQVASQGPNYAATPFEAESIALKLSPTYKELKKAQKNTLDAVYMKAMESDGQKARAGAWSDGNSKLYHKIPIERTTSAFGMRSVRARQLQPDQ